MAGMIKQDGAGGHNKRRAKMRPMADINVTPFVDVMLVLLIVFMVTAPLLTVGVPVNLPETQAATLRESDEPLVITINDQGVIFLQETEVGADNLVPRLQAVTRNNPDVKIYIRGDHSLQYGTVMTVMGGVSEAGFKKVSLLAKMPQK